MKLKINYNRFVIVYIFVFSMILFAYSTTVDTPTPIGEWDDYSLPVASILNEHDFGVSVADMEYYTQLYPQLGKYIDNVHLSGYWNKKGQQMAWYFPTYSIAVIPMTILLKILKMPTDYAFAYTNIFAIILALIVVWKWLRVSEKTKLILILTLSINPIVFYVGWISAEVFIYAMLVVAATCWYNQWYKRAGIFVSVAGMLNPTIMAIGLIMIAEYMFNVFRKEKDEKFVDIIRKNIVDIIKYACCFVIGLIPMIYNYYNVRVINLTAGLSVFTHGTETTTSRFLAYLFDYNFGIFPYYPILIGLSIMLIICSIIKRKYRFLVWMAAFLINVYAYSFMTYINSGMSGIARYSVWGSVLLIFAVCIYSEELISKKNCKKVLYALLMCECIWSGVIVYTYGPVKASNTSYMEHTPIAKYILEKAPVIYNPLHSTFNSRTTNQDIEYELPIVYTGDDGYVRKVLATSANKQELLNEFCSETKSNDWWEKKINSLDDTEKYISVPARQKIVKVATYVVGEKMMFDLKNNNVDSFIVSGLSQHEEWGAWTDGKEFSMRFKVSSSAGKQVHGSIVGVANNQSQCVSISINGEEKYFNAAYEGGKIDFSFEVPEDKIIDLCISIPTAAMPNSQGGTDTRLLGIGIMSMSFERRGENK